MLILPEEINKLLLISGEQVTKRGKKYFEQNRIKIKEVHVNGNGNFSITVYVEGNYLYEVNITKNQNGITHTCDCPVDRITPCKHVIATLFDIYINSEGYVAFKNYANTTVKSKLPKIEKKEKYLKDFLKSNSNPLIGYYETLDLKVKEEKDLKLIPTLEMSSFEYEELYLTLKIGKNKMYVIKDIYEFAQYFNLQEKIKFGKELELKLSVECFENKKFAQYIYTKANEYMSFAKLDNYFSLNKKLKNKLKIMYGSLDEFFDIFKGQEIAINDYYYTNVISLAEEDPKFEFELYQENESLVLKNLNYDEYFIYVGKEYNYILLKDKLYRCSQEFSKKALPLLKEYIKKVVNEIEINREDISSFCEYLVPNVSNYFTISDENELLQKNKPEILVTKVFLDLNDKKEITADIRFCYASQEINPFDADKNIVNVKRNRVKEQKDLKIIFDNKFIMDLNTKKLILTKDNDIYEFMQDGINIFMEKFEVLVTDKLKNKSIVTPKSMSMGLRIKNELLEIELDEMEFSSEELENILQSYKLKKKFYRLKDGSFVNIETSGIKTISDVFENTGVKFNSLDKKKFTVPKYRAVYLDKLLNSNVDISVKKETAFKELVRKVEYAEDLEFSLPPNMESVLREYQKTGYNWLKTLDALGFGGILADDMGLGKTLQIISILETEKEKKSTSIVICPSSLYLNWKKEINKFAPDLNVLVIAGGAIYRKQLIKNIKNYDVVITSYDLLKRDIEEYKDINFRYIIADEAQYIKNNNTKNAKALKELKGKTKFALTGTPIENSLAEVWSIFDFCMPGFLYTYAKFKNKFETSIIKDGDKEKQELLRKMVEPFILRRTKKEVLKELPDKTETKMYSVMDEKQEKIYKAYLEKAKKQIDLEIEENGLENSKMKILALITRLRQICCHPSLFLEDYDGESAKLSQCIQIIEDACSSSHKILVFSQFTSMFEIIKKELEKRNIKYYELTGKTKVDKRIELVDKFNKEDDVSVFLISLKAGGTGLNLTAADMVIHFDPWWNLSVQNQATDRAYRIGQRKNVQVFSLITENTIEEKVVKLQEAKQNLADNIITNSETFISKLSTEEIMKLFE